MRQCNRHLSRHLGAEARSTLSSSTLRRVGPSTMTATAGAAPAALTSSSSAQQVAVHSKQWIATTSRKSLQSAGGGDDDFEDFDEDFGGDDHQPVGGSSNNAATDSGGAMEAHEGEFDDDGMAAQQQPAGGDINNGASSFENNEDFSGATDDEWGDTNVVEAEDGMATEQQVLNEDITEDDSAAAAMGSGGQQEVVYDETVADEEEDGMPTPSAQHTLNEHGEVVVPESLTATNNSIVDMIADMTATPDVNEICELLDNCRSNLDVRRVLNEAIYTHPLMHDVLNGHGFRVHILSHLTSIAAKACCSEEWFDIVVVARHYGFTLARNYAANGFEAIRAWLNHRFNLEGRNPQLGSLAASRVKQLIALCREDGVIFDPVLFARCISILTSIVSMYDRQNRYRSNWPEEIPRREGIISDWVVGHERAADFDKIVLQCDGIVDEILQHMSTTFNCRPSFNVCYRLMDYYFATDNIEKMLGVLEDCHELGVGIAEASTAKAMQLACAMNLPEVPRLFQRWRVEPNQCIVAPPDVSRMLLYYARSGGGKPCPTCGEPYNHRNVSLSVFRSTPQAQLNCPELLKARKHKGELEDTDYLPQNQDFSQIAFDLLEYSQMNSLVWSSAEWRAFLLCCTNSPRAAEARGLINELHPDLTRWDDFLRMSYMRCLRLNSPEEIAETIEHWEGNDVHISPLVLQEALMGAMNIEDADARLDIFEYCWLKAKESDIYIMPYTKRYIQMRHDKWSGKSIVTGKGSKKKAVRVEIAPESAAKPKEHKLVAELMALTPKHFTQFQLKDSSIDIVPAPNKKSFYTARSRKEVEAARARRNAGGGGRR